jgi:hypothetical protein
VFLLVVVPVPLRGTVCGLPGALSVTDRAPVALPAALGVKETVIAQFAPDARLEPQVSVSPKYAVAAMPAILRVVVP